MNEKIDRLTSWVKDEKVGPLSLEIWPTNRCNLKCKMCGTWASRRRLEERGMKYNLDEEKKNEVSKKRLLKLIEEAKGLGVRECLLTGGGEPLIRKHLSMQLMKKIKEYGMFGNINTNGTLISSENVKKIIKMEWDMMMFSVDSPDPEDNDYIKGVKESFERVRKILLHFKEYKKKIHSKKPKIVFNTVLTNKIYNRLGEMIEFASEVGCEDITFIPLIIYDELVKTLELNENENKIFQQKVPRVIKLSEKLGVHTNLPTLYSNLNESMDEKIMIEIKNSPNDLTHSPCFEPFLHFLVKGNGEATACCMLENSPENIKRRSLEDTWFGEYFTELRRKIINRSLPKECKNCVFSQFIRNKQTREELKVNLFKKPI